MACRFLLISVFLPISLCNVSPVWKTPITERRFAPSLKRSSSPYYTRPEDFRVPNYQPPLNELVPPVRLPITPPGFRPNYNIYPRPFQSQPTLQRNLYRPAYPQAYQPRPPPRNGWIYWNGVIVPPEALPYLEGAGPIPPHAYGAYGPQSSTLPPMSPGVRPETFTGSIPMSPSVSPTESLLLQSTLPITAVTNQNPITEIENLTTSITPEEATMGNLFTANKNPYLPEVESTYGITETSTVSMEETTESTSKTIMSVTEENTTSAEYFPRPIPAQAYQPPKGPEIVEKLNVNILHPPPCTGIFCLDKTKVSIYTPPKGPKLLISNAVKGQANLPRPSVPEQKYLPYFPSLSTPAGSIEPSPGPRVFIPSDAFLIPKYETTNQPQITQEAYSPTARIFSSEYSPPSAPPPSPPSYTPLEENSTPTVPDYNRGPGSTIPPILPYTETTTPRLPTWAKTSQTEETFIPTFKPLSTKTPEGPTPPPRFTGFQTSRTPSISRLPPQVTFPSEPSPLPNTSKTPPSETTRPNYLTSTGPPSAALPNMSILIPSLPSSHPTSLSPTTLTPGMFTKIVTIPQFFETQTIPPSEFTTHPTFPSHVPEKNTPELATPPIEVTLPPSFSRETPGVPEMPEKFTTPSKMLVSKTQLTNPTQIPPSFGVTSTIIPGQSESTTPYFTRETVTTPSPYSTTQKRIQNRLRAGKVRVICQEDGIKFIAASILPFSGEIFANDRKRIPACLHTFQKAIMPTAFLPFAECGVKNPVEQTNKQTQYHIQVIVVVKQEDGSTTVQSYMAQCIHQKIKYNKQTLPGRIEEALEELRLVPTKLEQKALLPLAEMKLLVDEHGRMGPEVAAVDIGMPLALHWSLTNESNAYGFHVKNCAVADLISGMDMTLVDEHGCSTDTTILGHLLYDTYHDKASSHMWAFKVPDHTKLKISCDVFICTDISATDSNETSCSSIPTPPFCPDLITSPLNSIILDKGAVFLKRRRETVDLEADIQTVRAAICTSEDCRRDYVHALQHCIDPRLLAVSSAFSGSLFLLSILVNLAIRWKVSHEKSHYK